MRQAGPGGDAPAFQEARPGEVPMRELGLTIAGTPLEPILAEFEAELSAAGVARVRPRFYLSTEWGVPFETVAVAIPFYLVRPDLAQLHADRTGLVEGIDRGDILRYLRHEMGHVVNYAYKLYDRPDWVERFGSITQPYIEEYRPQPWSTRFVRHLPGWYAQKHPDEDWAETFAVWMTPGIDWRADYAAWPEALAKLELCAAIMTEIAASDPLVTDDELDEELSEIDYSIEDYYREVEPAGGEFPPGLAGGLRAIFSELPPGEDRRRASTLILAHAGALARAIYTWTGHFPEHTRALLLHLAQLADALDLSYPEAHQAAALVALTAFATSLAMNHVHRGSYTP
jgi:hypothetical protein